MQKRQTKRGPLVSRCSVTTTTLLELQLTVTTLWFCCSPCKYLKSPSTLRLGRGQTSFSSLLRLLISSLMQRQPHQQSLEILFEWRERSCPTWPHLCVAVSNSQSCLLQSCSRACWWTSMDRLRAAQLVKISMFCVFFSVTSASSNGSVGLTWFHSVWWLSAYKRVLGTLSQSWAKPSQLRGLSPPGRREGWRKAEGVG